MPAGRPLKFETVEKFEQQAEQYFKETPPEEWTITGLALALDTSRETLMNYEEKDEFFDAVKKAKLKIEHSYEKRLIKRGAAGDIFGLKNFGWKDKQETELSNPDGSLKTIIINKYAGSHQSATEAD